MMNEIASLIVNFGSLFNGFGVSDVVDLAITSFVIYELWSFASSTRAAQLIKGIIFLVFFYLVADLFNLYTVTWIMNKVFDIGLIAIVIVFQPELRRALEFVGRGKLNFNSRSVDRAMAGDYAIRISRAIDYFSQRKEGALIILEKETALNDIADTGTIIDAELSETLIENLFYKGSPLHDGAVIIRKERVLAAGCVLPLTENQGLSKDLGTRHRAAIGISEVSDALVLVVSEETGIISIAVDGKLKRFLDLKTVEKNLINYYFDDYEEESSSRLLDFFRKKPNEIQ